MGFLEKSDSFLPFVSQFLTLFKRNVFPLIPTGFLKRIIIRKNFTKKLSFYYTPNIFK